MSACYWDRECSEQLTRNQKIQFVCATAPRAGRQCGTEKRKIKAIFIASRSGLDTREIVSRSADITTRDFSTWIPSRSKRIPQYFSGHFNDENCIRESELAYSWTLRCYTRCYRLTELSTSAIALQLQPISVSWISRCNSYNILFYHTSLECRAKKVSFLYLPIGWKNCFKIWYSECHY